MANPEHLEILKQGAEHWNEWRRSNRNVLLDIRDANLSGVVLSGASLSRADFYRADLSGASLRAANLSGANLSGANLTGAGLSTAKLYGANFYGANLSGTDFIRALVGSTNFANAGLSDAVGLETVQHDGPSTIGIDTIYKSRGKIPEVFLRGCGVPDEFIAYIGSMVGRPIEFYSCFISYSTQDQEFTDQLYADLQAKGVRCWFAPEDLKIGDKFQDRIEESIRFHDKLLLVLSEDSINSPWVEDEVQAALERERRDGKLVLFPVRLDDAVMETSKPWAASLRRTRHIGDFTRWKDHDSHQSALARLLRDLKAERTVTNK